MHIEFMIAYICVLITLFVKTTSLFAHNYFFVRGTSRSDRSVFQSVVSHIWISVKFSGMNPALVKALSFVRESIALRFAMLCYSLSI